jgi:exonuclease VII small subunit
MDRIWANLSPFTEFAIILIALVGIGFHVRWSRRGAALGPTLLTTLGIFFCFSGIAWGLLDFDTDNVKSSVPHLLQGIRTSFWASVAGIGFALTIKVRHIIFGEVPAPQEGAASGATVDDLADQLIRLNKGVSSNNASGLLGQLNLLREGTNTRLDRLTDSFEKYAEKVAESNSKALIQALQEVIRDFNTKINEQFGENFKQLNASVGKLLTWQIRYQEQLDALIVQETATRKNMTEASLRYADLVNKSGVFANVAQSLTTILAGLETQREHLETSLGSFAGLINKAATGLPQIERNIVAMTEQIAQGVRANQEQLTASFQESVQTMQTANAALNDHVRQATEDSRKHIMLLDKALEEELRRSIESLGRQLTALSQKFVQDYTPLTAQLQRVLQATRLS